MDRIANRRFERPLRVALAGGGRMAEHHARAIERSAGLGKLVAFADPSDDARRRLQEIAPEAAAFGSLGELLADRQIDVVHIVTPPATHFALAQMALAAGCHVYVEKPVVETLDQVDNLINVAEAEGRLLCPGHQLLFEPPAREAMNLLPALGRVCHLESYFSFRPVRRTPDGKAPLRTDLQLLDILPHPVYVLLHFLESLAPGGTTELAGLDVGRDGTIHGLVRRGAITGALTVTLTGRPVESYLRVVGSNGSVYADFVRSTVQRQIGPGSSGIDKALSPYRLARQLLAGTTAALTRRIMRRQRSYPGLAELFAEFYTAILEGKGSPVSPVTIRETVRISELVSEAVRSQITSASSRTAVGSGAPTVAVTGGTGFLGKAIVSELQNRGVRVLVLARRQPAPWDRQSGVEYAVADLGGEVDPSLIRGCDVVVHAAAETAGGWAEHQSNSLDTVERILRAAAAAGVKRVVQVSSLAVLDGAAPPLSETTPLLADSRSAGPYVWGKLESERLARSLGSELGIRVKVVRPGAIIDYTDFEPPGRLGKRLGNLFVAVGSSRDRLGTVDLALTARVIADYVEDFESAPEVLNLIDPVLPAKATLVQTLRATNPDLTVLWLPMWLLYPLSWAALALQKILRPGRPAINVAQVFQVQRYDTSRVAAFIQGTKEKQTKRDSILAAS